MHTYHIPNYFNDGRHGRWPTGRVGHTYREIAMIIAERDGESISPTHVKQICRTAEEKFVSALLADPAVCSGPDFDQPADHTLRLRGGRDGCINKLRRN